MNSAELLDNLLAEINRLKLAEKLLEEIWDSSDGYTPIIDQKLWYKIQDYFGFDDGE